MGGNTVTANLFSTRMSGRNASNSHRYNFTSPLYLLYFRKGFPACLLDSASNMARTDLFTGSRFTTSRFWKKDGSTGHKRGMREGGREGGMEGGREGGREGG